MGFQLEDGTGSGKTAKVDQNNNLTVRAEIERPAEVVSLRDGRTFNWISQFSSAAAGNKIIYLKNTSTTRDLHIDRVWVSGLNAIDWTIFESSGAASGGATITGKNLNLKSGVTAEATALGTSTITITNGDVIRHLRSGANVIGVAEFDGGLILGPNDAIHVVHVVGTTGKAEVQIRGYYLDIE